MPQVSDAELLAQLEGSSGQVTDAGLLQQLEGSAGASLAQAQAQDGSWQAPAPPPNFLQKAEAARQEVMGGELQGLRDVGLSIAPKSPAPGLAFTPGGALANGLVALHGRMAGDTAEYEASPQSDWAKGGRILGSTAAMAPLMAGGGELLSGLGTVGKFIAGTLPRSAPVLARVASVPVSGAVQGAAGAELAAGEYPAEPGEGAEVGAGVASVLGLPRALAGYVSPAAAALGKWAVEHGIDVTAPQLISATKASEAGVAGRGVVPRTADQSKQLTAALADSIGAVDSTGAKATSFSSGEFDPMGGRVQQPGVFQATTDRIGREFEKVAGTPVVIDALGHGGKLIGDLSSIESDARSSVLQGTRDDPYTPVKNTVDAIFNTAVKNGGSLSGKDYLTFTQKGGPIDDLIHSTNPKLAQYGMAFRDALDDALERAAPKDLQAGLAKARQNWKDLMALKPAIARVGPDGVVDPKAVLGLVNRSYGKGSGAPGAVATGASDVGGLAQVAQTLLPTPPAATRPFGPILSHAGAAAKNLLLGAGFGEGLGLLHGPEAGPAIAGAALGGTLYGGNLLRAAAANSAWYRNQLLRWSLIDPSVGQPVAAGLAGGQIGGANGR